MLNTAMDQENYGNVCPNQANTRRDVGTSAKLTRSSDPEIEVPTKSGTEAQTTDRIDTHQRDGQKDGQSTTDTSAPRVEVIHNAKSQRPDSLTAARITGRPRFVVVRPVSCPKEAQNILTGKS